MYVKYHPLMKLEFEDDTYKHIKAFPTGYEYYEILNMADTLITDYSSVFYDFANSHQKIILYTYDKEEYFRDRGVYVSLDEFPFPQATTIDELIEAINNPKDYEDSEFIKNTVLMTVRTQLKKYVSESFSENQLQMKKSLFLTVKRTFSFMPVI